MSTINNKLLFIAAFLFFNNTVLADDNSNISITDVWISEAPPTVSILAAYADINNKTSDTVTLASVSSPDFKKIELHLSKVVNDTATMVKQDNLNIAADSIVKLSPGAFHLMLFEPEKPMKSGDTAVLEFKFTNGTSISVSADVKKRNSSGHEHHHHHH